MADTGSPETQALYRRMRAAGPVHFDERSRWYSVVRYDDVRGALADHATFSSDWGSYAPGSLLDRMFDGAMVAQDPPRHTRLRALVSRAFTQRSIADLEHRIARTAHELLDAVAAQGRMELNRDVAGVLPTMVIAELLGVPRDDHAYFRAASLRIVAYLESAARGGGADGEAQAAQAALEAYLRSVLEERRARPREDLISHLIASEIDGERLSERELVAFVRLLLGAGNTTMAKLLTGAVLSLLEHPGELARVRADPGLLPSAIEEVLRWRPPSNVWFRVTARDADVGGTTIPAKQQVLLLLGSANHDETVFPDPDRFDVGRSPNPHLAFSAGPHFCLGASLARIEAQATLRALLERFEDLEIAKDEPVVLHEGMQSNGAVQLPLRFGGAAVCSVKPSSDAQRGLS